MLETYLVKQLKFSPSFKLRLITRSLYVGKLAIKLYFLIILCIFIHSFIHSFIQAYISAFTMIVGICIPFFGSLLGFFGGFALAPTSYYVRVTVVL